MNEIFRSETPREVIVLVFFRFKVPITNFFYFLIQIYTSSNDVSRKNFLIPTKSNVFKCFFFKTLKFSCLHFVPPFALVSSRLDWCRDVGSRNLTLLKPSDLVLSFSIVENIPWKMLERCVAARCKR